MTFNPLANGDLLTAWCSARAMDEEQTLSLPFFSNSIKLIEDYTFSNPFILLVRGTHHYNEIVSSRIIGMQQICDKTKKA